MVEVSKRGLSHRKWAALEHSAQEPPGAISALIPMTFMTFETTSYRKLEFVHLKSDLQNGCRDHWSSVTWHGCEILNSANVIFRWVSVP